MKRLLYIIAAGAVLTFAGCSNEKDLDIDLNGGKGLEFVHFESTSDAWLVTADDESYDYEVVVGCTQKHDTDVTYNITVGEKTTGVEGVDFSIPVKSVTIKAGEYLGVLPVKVLYATTGEGFEIELILSVDEGLINDSYGNVAKISVKSDKITIDWAWLEGNWIEQDSAGDPYGVSFTKVDDTHVSFTNLWGMESSIVGVVDFTARTISFPAPTSLGEAYGGELMVAHIGADGKYDDQPVVAVMSPLGITIKNLGFYIVGGGYDGYDFGEDSISIYRG